MPKTTPIVHPAQGSIDPATWRNDLYPYYVIQARPRDSDSPRGDDLHAPGGMFETGLCLRHGLPVRRVSAETAVDLDGRRSVAAEDLRRGSLVRDGDGVVIVDAIERDGEHVVIHVTPQPCPGTSRDAASWVFLHRRDALHATFKHYAHPNMSVCRFRSAARGDYAADLVFEIDAHDTVPAGCPIEFFERYIGAAVDLGRCVLDYLTGPLAIEPRYITTAISRMGARVTVDWRAFGPRRLFEILAVIKYIELEVVGTEGLTDLAKNYGVPELVIDTGPYQRSDLPRPSAELGNAFIGPWLRPIGAVHTKSSNAAWWYRTIAVGHEMFRPDNAAQLVAQSRAKGSPPQLLKSHVRAPESRLPIFDRLIEDAPKPAVRLIELFEDDELLEKIRPDDKALVERFQRSGARPRRPAGSPGAQRELHDDDLRRVLDALGAEYIDKGERYVFDCVVPSCKKGGKKASVHKESGLYGCWRAGCRQGVHLAVLAAELGYGHLVAHARHSSEPTQWIKKTELTTSDLGWSSPLVELVAPDCATVHELREQRRIFLQQGMVDPDVRVMIDVSDTGLGKSTAARQLLEDLQVRYRIFCPRDDVKRDYGDLLPGAVLIEGRRYGENCTNDGLKEVTDRAEPVGETLCSGCADRAGCPYLAKMKLAATSNTILAHQHGPFATFATIDNGSEIDVVDEDALDAVSDVHALDAEELRRMRTRVGYRFCDDDDDDYADLDAPGELQPRAAATERVGRVLDRLEQRLTHDAVVDHDAEAAAAGRIGDLALGRLLFRDTELRKAVLDLGQEDIDAYEEERLGLVAAWQAMRGPMGNILPPDVEAAWETSPEREAARGDADAPQDDHGIKEMVALAGWVEERLVPVPWPETMKTDVARPKAIFPDIAAALQDLCMVVANGADEPTRLLAIRPKKAGPWVLRLTRRRPFLEGSRKVLYLSATTNRVRTELLLGVPRDNGRWRVFAPRLRRREVRTIIADRSYTKTAILRDDKLRLGLFETTTALIRSEAARTTMPVALMGPTAIIASYLKAVLGDAADTFKLNAKLSRTKREELRTLTTAHGFIVGWAYGVAGSNDFAVEQDCVRRFLRSAVILGNPLPNLNGFADQHRGLFAEHYRLVVDDDNGVGPRVVGEPVIPNWGISYRTVPFAGQERGDETLAAMNMMGFGDAIANEVLDGRYLAEVVQMAGRIRSYIPDPVEPALEPRVFVFGAVAIPGWGVDRVVGLDDLRTELGLQTDPRAPRGRPSTKTPEQALRDAVKERGPKAVISVMAKKYLRAGKNPEDITTLVRLAFGRAELDFSGSRVREVNAVVAKFLLAAGRNDEAGRLMKVCGGVGQTA